MSEAQEPIRKPGRPATPWSFRIATIAGIPVRVHFTFILFLLWIELVGRAIGRDYILLIPAIFLCVVLHEFGHALVAKRYGVKTRDITLYPIGGVAMLEGKPKPAEEFWIALAGPAVNMLIALILAPILYFTEGGFAHVMGDIGHQSVLEGLLAANIIIPLFNLIPAFPMDGGRVLRAALAMNMDETRATQIAASIGQGLAFVLGMVGLFTSQIILMLIAFFVFVAAGQELSATVGRSIMAGHRITDAMLTDFRTINTGDSMDRAAKMLLEASQQDFPVVVGDEVVGLLTRNDIARGLASEGPSGYVAGAMRREYKLARPDLPLQQAMEMFNGQDTSPILVMNEERLVGMVTSENLSEFIMLEQAKMQARSHHS